VDNGIICLSITYVIPPGRRFFMDTGGMAWNIPINDTPKILAHDILPEKPHKKIPFHSGVIGGSAPTPLGPTILHHVP
jgi:hypothetical protein